MKSLIPFGAAIVAAAVGLTQLDLDLDRVADRGRDARASAASDLALPAAPDAAAPSMPYSAAAIRLDPPPVALVCREEAAEVAVATGGRTSDFLEEFLLVSDPRESCRDGDLAARGGYDREGGRCYTLRNPSAAEPDLPLVCSERFGQDAGGLAVSQMECQGWNRRIATADGGGFSFTIAAPGAEPARLSQGTCRPL